MIVTTDTGRKVEIEKKTSYVMFLQNRRRQPSLIEIDIGLIYCHYVTISRPSIIVETLLLPPPYNSRKQQKIVVN